MRSSPQKHKVYCQDIQDADVRVPASELDKNPTQRFKAMKGHENNCTSLDVVCNVVRHFMMLNKSHSYSIYLDELTFLIFSSEVSVWPRKK